MPDFSTIAGMVHVLAAAVWVGGMFFAYLVLRPSLSVLDPHQRFALWNGVLPRFFLWVWACVIGLLPTGYIMVFREFGEFATAGLHVQIMHGTGLAMTVIFIILFSVPFQHFREAVRKENWEKAAKQLAFIRGIVGINLLLGLVTIITAVSGRFVG
jgi:uncharacterized membrane protein